MRKISHYPLLYFTNSAYNRHTHTDTDASNMDVCVYQKPTRFNNWTKKPQEINCFQVSDGLINKFCSVNICPTKLLIIQNVKLHATRRPNIFEYRWDIIVKCYVEHNIYSNWMCADVMCSKLGNGIGKYYLNQFVWIEHVGMVCPMCAGTNRISSYFFRRNVSEI